MDLCATMDLETIEVSIRQQIDAVVRAPSSARYAEILRLQMLREMRDILKDAYRFSLESADLFHEATSEA